jgi:hypothetical protein
MGMVVKNNNICTYIPISVFAYPGGGELLCNLIYFLIHCPVSKIYIYILILIDSIIHLLLH